MFAMKTKSDLIIPHSREESKPAFLERFLYLPKRGFDHKGASKIDWNHLFDRPAPIYVEVCSGNGQWIGEQAKERRDLNWVAVELDFARARKIWLKSFREDLPNLYVVCGEGITFLTHYVERGSVSEVFVNFPDPWPKRRHAKNRLIQAPFVSAVRDVLHERGCVTLATDDPPCRAQMEEQFGTELELISSEQDVASYGDSFFASLWKSKGKNLFYLKYRKKS